MEKYKIYWGIFVIIIFSFWAIKPLFMPGFFPMHDDVQVARVFEMGRALKDGMFPVRWVNDLGYGYGYPIFNFYAPLAYYIGGFFIAFTHDALLATKITMMVGILFAGISMYFLARKFWGEIGGIISGLFYVYANYHAVDIYVRGDVAEFWAYAFIPLVFLGFYEIYVNTSLRVNPQTGEAIQSNTVRATTGLLNSFSPRKDVIGGTIIGAVGYAGIILSHNLTAFMTTIFLIPVLLLLILFSNKKIQTTSYILLAAILGLFLSAFYWLPVPFEMKYTNVLSQVGGSADFRQHFVCLSQFWYSTWGYGGSVPGCTDGISFMIGKLHIFFALISLAGIILFWKKKKSYAVIIIVAFLAWIVALFFTTEFSLFIWKSFPLMVFLQYPWRFLLFAAFFASFLAGSIARMTEGKIFYFIGSIIIFLLIFFQSKVFFPQKILSVSSDYYTNKQTLLWKASKISDEYLPKYFVKPHAPEKIVPKTFILHPVQGKILSDNEKTQEKNAVVESQFDSLLLTRLAYFPAWHYYVNIQPAWFQSRDGRILVRLPKGKHILTMRFEQTPIEITGNILSLTGFLCIILGIIYLSFGKEKSPY